VVPASYHDFFASCATVAGALIGLLFVAISVSQGRLAGDRADSAHQVKAGAAFSALVNALVIALVGLMPGASLGVAAIILAAAGLSATVGLGIVLYREHVGPDRAGHVTLAVVLLIVLLTLYALQLANGIALDQAPGSTGRLSSQCALSIMFFVFAIARAWELTGARDRHLLPVIAGMTSATAAAPAGRPESQLQAETGAAAEPAPAPIAEGEVSAKGGVRQ
jgi:hypothetical protein